MPVSWALRLRQRLYAKIVRMNNDEAKKRVGRIRLSGLTWKMNSELIKQKIGRENIIDIVQPQDDGNDLDAHDIVFVHPDFDEINEGDPIPIYSFNFATDELRRVADAK